MLGLGDRSLGLFSSQLHALGWVPIFHQPHLDDVLIQSVVVLLRQMLIITRNSDRPVRIHGNYQ